MVFGELEGSMPVGADSKIDFRELVDQEIRRKVARAIETKSILVVSDCVHEITKKYPATGFSKRRIGDWITMAAARAGVPVVFGSHWRLKLPPSLRRW